MLAKGEKGVNGKCVLLCTKLEKEWSVFAQGITSRKETADPDIS